MMEGLQFHFSTQLDICTVIPKQNSGCNTGLNSSLTIMFVRPCPVLLKTSGMLQGKNLSSGLRFKHENIAFTNTTHAKKILLWIALSPNYNMYAMTEAMSTHSHGRLKLGLTVV